MSYRYVTLLAIAAIGLLGAGCAKTPTARTGATPEDINAVTDRVAGDGPGETLPRQDIQPAGDNWEAYQRATVMNEGSQKTVEDTPKMHRITFRVPSTWVGEGVWRPVKDDPLNYIRARYLPGTSAEQAWNEEQTMTSLYENVRAEERDGTYLFTADHKSLKVAVATLFVPDAAHPETGRYFIECHIAHDAADREALWNACKTAMTSAVFENK